ncbi:cilia- and flagella-associated protein 251-like isoform X1 [Xiphophorus hellerii]|uniref:cilia- and flagella-associated protein 251-like isoform X1 n=1 Tax=Xiphophorus hellerii TaxID=8084 RepID=UPI0013B3DAFC|nr:cilia- and flagella-associated protein 251-like isoform X1 [Xiphophorus hellerii]
MKEKYWEEREQYWNMLEKTEGTSKHEEEEQQDEEQEEDEETKKKESDFESGKAGEKTGSSEMKRVEEGESGEEKVRPSEGVKEEESSCAVELQACDEMEGKDWQQMLRLVMILQNEGNFLIKEQHFPDASAKFKEALGYVDFLQNKQVDQHGEDWESLEKVRLPLSLNLSQSMLELKQYQEVVELNSRLLKTHRGNFKATYQRARAHAALCNEDEARRDFATVEKLDPKFKPFVQKELKILGENIRKMHAGQKKNYWETTKEKWGPVGSRTKDAVRKKSTNSAKKATEKNTEMDKNTESHKVEERESPAEHRPVETEGAGDSETGKHPDLKAERCDKEQMCGRTSELGSDKEKPARVAAPEADNHRTDKDGDPASTSSDNVVSRRSRNDKGKKKKVKRQSRNAAKRTKSGTEKGDGPIN